MDCLRTYKPLLYLLILISITIACTPKSKEETTEISTHTNIIAMNDKPKLNISKSEHEWKEDLSPEQYYVLREAGTERPFTGKYNMHFEKGIYTCAGCGEELFSSESKFDGHCGWPSFDDEIAEGKIIERADHSYGLTRVEILCGNCGSHLGHIFDDGPTKTGLRYCVNSLSLNFTEK